MFACALLTPKPAPVRAVCSIHFMCPKKANYYSYIARCPRSIPVYPHPFAAPPHPLSLVNNSFHFHVLIESPFIS